MSSLPTGIFDKLTKLKYLYLSGNQLKSINKDAFNKLTKLEELALDRNHIFNIPQGVFNNLTKLKLIGISENRLNNLPRDIFINNTELTSVNFSNNNIKEMPTSIKNANNLQEIIAHNNNIEILPKELKSLNNLEKLHLTNNSIKEIPVDIFKSLNKLTILEMNNNDIISVPDNIEEILPNLFKGMYSSGLQLKYNRLTKISEKLNRLYEKEKFKYVPQKNLMNLKLVNDNGTLRWDHKLSALDILCWGETPNSFFDNIDPKTLEEYSKYLNGRSTIDVLNKKGWDWTIQVEVQKKNEHGDFETIHTVTTEEEEDKVGNYSVGNIENNDDYRIVKSLYGTTMNDKSLIFKETAYIGDTLNNSLAINNTKPSPEPTPIEGNSGASSNIKPENKPQAKPEVQPKNKENQVSKTKDINVQVLKEKSHEPSMAAQYVEKTIKYTEKDGKKYFTVTLNRMDWMKNVAIEVGGNKVTAEKKENGNIGEYTFEVGSEKEEVMMRMNVVPMGNARVAFRIVNAAAAPKDTTKQDVEPEEPKDTVKPEKPDNTEKPNEKPEIPKDTEKSIIKKEKPAIYEAKVIVDVINKENEKVITNYVDVEQKINVEVKDKQAYMTIKLKGKQKDIKGIKVDGKVAKFEVVEQEVVKQNRLAALNAERAVNTDKNKESTTIRFKIPNEKVNVEIIMHDEVENKNVSFEVKLKEDTIKEIKDNSKQDVKTSNTTSSTSHSHHRRKKHNKESEDVKDNKEDKKDTKDDNTSSKDTKIKEDGNNSDKPNNDVKDHALKNDNSKDNKDTKKENKKDNNASEKQKSKNDVNVNNKNDESKKVQAEYSKQNEEQQKQNKIVSTQKAINTKISIKKNSKGNKNIEIKEKKLPQTGTPFGSGLFTTIGSAISALGVMLMRKNKKK
ncbi:NEAT domain-containing protein [Clostridium botulinum]|nr:NEAT domain-containing protein [Clostridium botulinum]